MNKPSAPRSSTPKAGLQQVAEAAGVSVATVSRVFSGSKPVSSEVRERVMEAALTAGFAPNALARALKTGRLDTVGIVLAGSNLMGEFYSETLCGFHSVCGRNNLKVMVSIIHEEGDVQQKVLETIHDGWCAGLAIHCTLVNEPRLLQSLPVPVTLLNYTSRRRRSPAGISSVGFDNGQGVHEAVRHLAALGHRRIAYLSGSRLSQDAADREQAFRAAISAGELPLVEEWIIPCSFERGPETGREAMEQIYRGRGRGSRRGVGEWPTAVICASDNIALGAINAADRWGQSVPRDLSVIGFDDCSWAANYRPPLTTVAHKGWALGAATAETLLAHLENPAAPPPPIVLPTQLVVRESTSAPRE